MTPTPIFQARATITNLAIRARLAAGHQIIQEAAALHVGVAKAGSATPVYAPKPVIYHFLECPGCAHVVFLLASSSSSQVTVVSAIGRLTDGTATPAFIAAITPAASR